RTPISASRPHSFSSKPGSSLTTSRRCSASYPLSRPRTASRRADCSLSSVKSMWSEPQDRAGDDLTLDLVGPAVDRRLAEVEVVGPRDAGPVGGVGLARYVVGQ